MTRRNWKRIRPHSLRYALELCKEHARERRNLSVERIAELMGLADHWALYKWFQSGRIPANLIRPFEHVCGIATYQCSNVECGHTFKAGFEIIATISPSAMPNPAIVLPMVPRRAKAVAP